MDELKDISPYQGFLQHRENLLAIYRLDINDFEISERDGDEPKSEESSPSKMNKFFYHYYYMLLLNIPTLLRIIEGKINWEVMTYSINNSIKCAHLISKHGILTKQQKTRNLLLIKLYCI
jgi:hypothetical protein